MFSLIVLIVYLASSLIQVRDLGRELPERSKNNYKQLKLYGDSHTYIQISFGP
jgi:hypothetical protein